MFKKFYKKKSNIQEKGATKFSFLFAFRFDFLSRSHSDIRKFSTQVFYVPLNVTKIYKLRIY